MKIKGDKLITAYFVITIISVLTQITALVLRIVYSATGWNSSYLSSSCSSAYYNLKYGNTYLTLRAHFIVTIVAIIAGLISILLLVQPLKAISLEKSDNNVDKNKESERQVKLQIIYVLISVCLLGQSAAAGGPLSFWVQARVCSFTVSSSYIGIAVVSLVAFILTLIGWVLVVCMLRNQVVVQIRFQDIKIRREEDELSKRIDDEIKEYLYALDKNKAEMQQQLLLYEQQIYESNKYSEEKSKHEKQGKQVQGKEQSSYEYYYEEVEGSAILPSAESNTQNIQEDDFQPSPRLSPSLSPSLSRNRSKGLKKGVSKLQMELQRVPNQNGEHESNDAAEGQLSSPRSKRVGAFQKSSSNSPQQKSPPVVKRVEVINQIDNNGWQQLGNFRLEAVQQPMSEEVGKLLKTILFDNSPFFQNKRPKLQQECPLQKYLLRDQRYEIPHERKFNKKDKRNEYSKQELIFVRKRKDKTDEQTFKELMKQEFDENSAIIRERQDRLNSQQLENIETQQKEKGKTMPIRYKKYNIIESIRSKYYE